MFKRRRNRGFRGWQRWRSTWLALLLVGVLMVLSVEQLWAVPGDGSPVSDSQAIKGVWLTNVDSDVLYNQQALSQAITDLDAAGFNTLYPTVWNDGYTLHPSDIAANRLHTTRHAHPGLVQRDLLAEIIAQAKPHGLRVIPWLEFGFMAPADRRWVKSHPDWLTQNAENETVWLQGNTLPRVWLNPLHPEVQELLIELALEIINRYDIDGIQLDDHFGYPSQWGYDPLTLARYQAETGQQPPAPPKLDPNQNCVNLDSDWQAWTNWRADQITAFVQKFVTRLKSVKPDLIIAVSPNPQTFSKNCYLLDWQQWQQLGLIDELVLQVYREKQADFERELQDPAVQTAKVSIPVVVGILTGLKNRPVPFTRIQQQTDWSIAQGFAGVAYFFYESLWHLNTKETESSLDSDTRQQHFRHLLHSF